MKTKPQTSVHDHPAVAAKRSEIAAVDERLKQAAQREAAARARLRDLAPVMRTADAAKKRASLASKAKQLLAGGIVSSADPAAEVVAAEREQSILREAQIELAAEFRAIVAEISDQFTTDYLAPLVRADTVELYGHLAQAASVMARLRGRTADALRLGYRVSSAQCPDFVPPVAWRLGDPADTGSELARMRNALVTKGWMK
jgi:hypothetical protein